MAAGSGDVQRSPSLAVGLVDAGVVFQQEGNHIHAAIDAGLQGGKKEESGWDAATRHHFARGGFEAPKTVTKQKETSKNKDVNKCRGTEQTPRLTESIAT